MTRIEPGSSAVWTCESNGSANQLPRPGLVISSLETCAECSSVSVAPPQRDVASFEKCDEQKTCDESADVRAERNSSLGFAGRLEGGQPSQHELHDEPRRQHPDCRESSDADDDEADRQP